MKISVNILKKPTHEHHIPGLVNAYVTVIFSVVAVYDKRTGATASPVFWSEKCRVGARVWKPV